jgi:hypothetical protein
MSAAAGLKSSQSDQKRNFDVIRSATKTPRHQDVKYISSLRVPLWQNCYFECGFIRVLLAIVYNENATLCFPA